ncbi:4-hydroxy-tetrahydrodipicolinate synthase [Desertibaculum subflavum]|uniref:4-hydroxy-tetrahydrodipicolinate synthase n=1 Tax=Desertibaculum subflavum TaxID=2268458 RepID=UPI000E663907
MFKGSITALVTPFKNGKVDDKAFQALVDWQIKEGTHGLVPCGTTGESPTLTHEEHDRVVALCIEAAAGRVPVIAGTGSNSTDEAIRLTRHAKKAGATGALIVSPYYNKPTQAGLYAHFEAIAKAVDIPIVVYNIPPRCIVDIQVETMAKLAKLPNIVGVKDATGDIARITKQRRECGKDFIQLSGDDALALGQMSHGAVGCISVTANVAPRLLSDFQNAWAAGNRDKALELNDRLAPLHESLFVETSPAPIKFAMSLIGKCEETVRLPLAPIGEQTRERVKSAMRGVGLIN